MKIVEKKTERGNFKKCVKYFKKNLKFKQGLSALT